MKKIMSVLAMLISLASFSQKCNPRFFVLGTSGFITNYRETGVNVDAAVFGPFSKWYPSVNADVYTARKPESNQWTTAQVGVRLNVPITKNLILSAGPKYITQGGEKSGYNQWVFDGAASAVFKLVQRETGVMWFKLSTQYNSTPQQRVFFMAGFQFALL